MQIKLVVLEKTRKNLVLASVGEPLERMLPRSPVGNRLHLERLIVWDS